jgi:hypothetical protein
MLKIGSQVRFQENVVAEVELPFVEPWCEPDEQRAQEEGAGPTPPGSHDSLCGAPGRARNRFWRCR